MAYDLYPAKRARLLAEPLRAEDIRTNILCALRIMEETVQVTCAVVEAVKLWDGKRVTKRIAEDVRAKLNGNYTCYYSKNNFFGRLELSIWSNSQESALTYGNRMVLTLNEKESDFRFDLDWFEETQASRYVKRNMESISELKEALTDLDERVDAYNRALPGFREVLAGLGRVHDAAFERT